MRPPVKPPTERPAAWWRANRPLIATADLVLVAVSDGTAAHEQGRVASADFSGPGPSVARYLEASPQHAWGPRPGALWSATARPERWSC